MGLQKRCAAIAYILIVMAACTADPPRGAEPTGASGAPSTLLPVAPRSVVPTVLVDERTRTLIQFLETRVDGSGAEAFICCDAQRRADFEPERLYRYGDFDLIGYRIDERNPGLPASGGEPWFIATLFYEDGVLEWAGSSLDYDSEFLVVGSFEGSLRVTKWANEGTS